MMKNPILIAVGIIAVLVIGGGFFFANQGSQKTNDAEMTKDENVMTEKDSGTIEDDKIADDKMTAARYVEYSRVALEGAVDNRRVLFFYASWCPTCRPTDVNLKENTNRIPEDVTVIRVNYNDPETDQEEKDLAQKYGITYQHTFVQIDAEGKEVVKWNGGQVNELLKNIK
ncbi:MAG: thioredoxin domain-containing protein [Patescibacteria group bacterium]